MSVDIDIVSFSREKLLLKVEDGSFLKITGNNLKYSTLSPDESYELENCIEFEEIYTE